MTIFEISVHRPKAIPTWHTEEWRALPKHSCCRSEILHSFGTQRPTDWEGVGLCKKGGLDITLWSMNHCNKKSWRKSNMMLTVLGSGWSSSVLRVCFCVFSKIRIVLAIIIKNTDFMEGLVKMRYNLWKSSEVFYNYYKMSASKITNGSFTHR